MRDSRRDFQESPHLQGKGVLSGDGGNRTHGRFPSWIVALALFVTFALCFLGPLFIVDAFARCRTHKCWHKVSVRRHVDWAWRHYRAHPMPYCTWAYESGTWGSPWRRSRYRARNTQSTAGGKFQIIDRTWFAYGGRANGDSHPAAAAPPLEQEKIARRILAGQGPGAWVRC